MARFGIQEYRPTWLAGGASIDIVHGERLRALAGSVVHHVWLVWDLEEDVWFRDTPVLVEVGGTTVSVDHQKFDELCLTWNVLDPSRPIEWSGGSLAWCPDPLPELKHLLDQKVRSVDLLEWCGDQDDMANGMAAIGFTLESTHLTIFNALDENGLEFGPPGLHYRYFSSQHPAKLS
jgi:hypothetical protein